MDSWDGRSNLSTGGDERPIFQVMPGPTPFLPRRTRPAVVGYVVALLLVALSTVVGLLLAARWGSSAVVMLYLLPVLAAAITAGLRPGLAAAVASTLAFNYWFTEPLHTFQIHSADDIVTVAVLFVVAVVTSQLAASVRTQAALAGEHAARNATIAGFARMLMSCREEREVAEAAARRIADLFGCHVVVLGTRGEDNVLASAPGDATLDPGDLAAAAWTLESGELAGRGIGRGAQADWQFRPVGGDRIIAAVGLAREDGAAPLDERQALLFGSLIDQMALALERARLDAATRESAEVRAREHLRSAFLASIGEDVKPRLRTLHSGLRSLRRDGQADRELVSDLEAEVARVERYVDNLVELGPDENDGPLTFGAVSLDLHRRTILRGGEPVHLTPKEYAVLAELARNAGRVLSHTQILRAVWGPAQQDHVDYLRVAVRALRQKLEDDPARPRLIVNEPGVGYRLALPAAVAMKG